MVNAAERTNVRTFRICTRPRRHASATDLTAVLIKSLYRPRHFGISNHSLRHDDLGVWFQVPGREFEDDRRTREWVESRRLTQVSATPGARPQAQSFERLLIRPEILCG